MSDILSTFWSKLTNNLNPYSKSGLRNLTAAAILVLGWWFVSELVLPIGLLGNYPTWGIYLVALVIFYYLNLMLFSADTLYFGHPDENKYIEAFQRHWPSKHVAEKFSLGQEEAESYWFTNVFNAWSGTDHPQHQQWKRTLERGYACRCVYYMVRFLGRLIWIAIVAFSAEELLHKYLGLGESRLLLRIVFVLVALLCYVAMRQGHRVSERRLWGVWKRYDEINKSHIQWIDHNIHSLKDFETN
ncbi:hypothetical protein ACFL2Z_00080 [Candidatus Eisenbacteria bacterium]|uniref:Uncharacterized protein n=1 Tax=Eiseniibacteriota bacterium TaxID=2212470 RepID=A0ABV6YMZ8_UNCEI